MFNRIKSYNYKDYQACQIYNQQSNKQASIKQQNHILQEEEMMKKYQISNEVSLLDEEEPIQIKMHPIKSLEHINVPLEESQSLLVHTKNRILEELNLYIQQFKELSYNIYDQVYFFVYCFYSFIHYQSSTHIHSNEIVMTFGYSKTILDFLVQTKEDRKVDFEVFVVEEPSKDGAKNMYSQLKEKNIICHVIAEKAVFAIMQTMNKVLICNHSINFFNHSKAPQAVMWDGGIICKAGGLLLALAAKNFSVPFIVVTGVYKLTLKYAFDQSTFNELLPPNKVFKPQDYEIMDNIEVYVPKFNFIKPQYISLFVTDHGEYTISYIYRLFEDYYLLGSGAKY